MRNGEGTETEGHVLGEWDHQVPVAFKDWMIHEHLQFASRLAVRCVLHRYENLDIHC
jgi:hypothetical protein